MGDGPPRLGPNLSVTLTLTLTLPIALALPLILDLLNLGVLPAEEPVASLVRRGEAALSSLRHSADVRRLEELAAALQQRDETIARLTKAQVTHGLVHVPNPNP